MTGNCRSGIVLAKHHRLSDIFTYRLNGLSAVGPSDIFTYRLNGLSAVGPSDIFTYRLNGLSAVGPRHTFNSSDCRYAE